MEKYNRDLEALLKLIKYPLITPKAIDLYEKNQFTFVVDRSLVKQEIKEAIEKKFNVDVLEINTCILPQKTKKVGKYRGKRAVYKKVLIKLKNGNSIKELLTGKTKSEQSSLEAIAFKNNLAEQQKESN